MNMMGELSFPRMPNQVYYTRMSLNSINDAVFPITYEAYIYTTRNQPFIYTDQTD